MPVKTVFMFAGQGSQYYGMGRELLSGHPVFAAAMDRWSSLFAEHGMPDVRAEIYRTDRTPADPFRDIRFTHAAILTVELSLAEALRAGGVEPDCVLGASLGEFAAATAAGVLTPEQLAGTIVDQIGMLDGRCAPGAMTAVLGDVASYHGDEELRAAAELAAVNSDRHFVLSGDPARLAEAERLLDRKRIPYQRLPVDYAFHSARLDPVAEPYLASLAGLTLREPALPVVSCATAGYLPRFTPEHFWRLVRQPIRFRDAIRFLDAQDGDIDYVDLGPSATMANFVNGIVRPGSRSRGVPILDPFAPPGRALQRLHTYARDAQPVAGRPGPARREVTMRAVLFPGQGSQARGMGDDLFDRFPDLTVQADQILGYSIATLCRTDPRGELDRTEFTQPALFVVNALTHLDRLRAGADQPAYFAGHSLGEYNALWAAGAFDLGTGLRLVRERGRLMAAATGGGMAAVIGLDEAAVRGVLRDHALDTLDVANHNASDQLIVSGPRTAVLGAEGAFRAAGARAYLPLRVSGAFHSRYMRPAREEFERILAAAEIRSPGIPVIANVTGEPYPPDAVRRLLAEQLVRPVLWERSVRTLLAAGVSHFDEAGPGQVLTGLVRKIRQAPPAPLVAVPERPETPVQPAAGTAAAEPSPAETLGSAAFRREYGTRYAYACGAMYRGIASEELVIRAARAGLLAFFGTGGLDLDRIDQAVRRIKGALGDAAPYGMNLVHNPGQPESEDATVALLLRHGVRTVEASAFMKITPALVRYRLDGLSKGVDGEVVVANRIVAKVSRPEVAEGFLSPPPPRIVNQLERDGLVTPEQAALGASVPMADDLCVESDSGGHTDRGDPLVLIPTMLRLRDRVTDEHGYPGRVRVGAAGGIGTPEAAAAAFILGADFVLTGSINLCTAESGMSDAAKDMLEQIDVQDTDYAPAGDMFELGAQVQVLKRGVFFPARARKLYDLYRRHESLEEIDAATRSLIETRYFHRTFDEVWNETRVFFAERDPREIQKAEQNPKHRMALVFRWYFGHSQRAAMNGSTEYRVDFQVHCGPALGAFNQWVRDTDLSSWRNRHVDEIGELLMREAAVCLNRRCEQLAKAVAR